ncbi:hypothetical protein CISG_06856 [Coccidioides immitis RMSCC 3703]|uniref:Uncharacterized protein n=1 Tax=Coccidioides immitis RMSCC 3703 TaxID=454286 RepID=A0A0J8R0T9_COCIT|nr:hypothetical protein CISG_06856 [Coccidioides immitis RMSCC 3703]
MIGEELKRAGPRSGSSFSHRLREGTQSRGRRDKLVSATERQGSTKGEPFSTDYCAAIVPNKKEKKRSPYTAKSGDGCGLRRTAFGGDVTAAYYHDNRLEVPFPASELIFNQIS